MKKTITVEIFRKHFDGDYYDVRFSDLPKDIQPDDVISINREESFFSENNSWDAYTDLVVGRERLETDEEESKRLIKEAKFNVELKQRRYENYLRLKKEFDIN